MLSVNRALVSMVTVDGWIAWPSSSIRRNCSAASPGSGWAALAAAGTAGVTLLEGRGGYTGLPKQVVMTVVNNVQQKKLEELIFTLDPEAFVIFENTFNVIGKGFSRRKVY